MSTSFPGRVIEYANVNKSFFFVQVGANDGVRADPIYNFVKQYHWKGILVEPIEEYFDQLKKNYSEANWLIFENAAISLVNKINIFRIKNDAPWIVSYFGKTLSSSSRRILEKNIWFLPGSKKYIVKKEIPCLTLKRLLGKHKARVIDFLLIDTEGYDFEVLKQINDLKHLPKFVYYEHKHLSGTDKTDAWLLLCNKGYVVERDIWNTFAYLN